MGEEFSIEVSDTNLVIRDFQRDRVADPETFNNRVIERCYRTHDDAIVIVLEELNDGT